MIIALGAKNRVFVSMDYQETEHGFQTIENGKKVV